MTSSPRQAPLTLPDRYRRRTAAWQRLRAFLFAVGFGAAMATAACTREAPDSNSAAVAVAEDTVEVPPSVQERLGLEIVVARETEVEAPVIAPAVVGFDERRVARLGSPVEGRVREVLVEVGERVRAGQVLAWLYSPDWEGIVARLRTAWAEERSAMAEWKFATQQVGRARRLFAAKAAARQEVERAQLDAVLARNKLRAARAELARSKRELLALGGGLRSFQPVGLPIRSPLSGTVVERSASPGQGLVPGSPLFVVAQLDRVWLLAEVDERWLNRVAPGLTVRFRVSAYPDETFVATIEQVGDMLDPKTRRVKVRCTADNAQGKLKPEMFAQLEIPEPMRRTILTVPESALQQLDGQPVVFVPVGENQFRRQNVEVGDTGEGWVEVKRGLRNGDRIVGRGSFLLKSTLVLRTQPVHED
ncbi:Cobalt-zinc-cadmium resistance protein CzcB [bacterium HR30]|nr:Cobalt-zinc-cadmium resistance protein CzcB [bacterium HR30]